MPASGQTKLLLAQSLQKLMLTMPLEKISVNDIVEQAGVGRNTFYYHFADKYDLVTWYFQTGVTPFLFERARYGSWQSLLAGLQEYFRQNKVFYQNALAYTGQNSLAECRSDLSSQDMDFLSHFLAGAAMGVLIPWVHNGMKNDILLQSKCIQTLYDENLLRQLMEDIPANE